MKHRVWLGIRIFLAFALFAAIGLLPALSVIPVSAVPPLADMQRSEGTISFRPVGGRSGSLTVLKRSGGGRDEFSCREHMAGLHTCIDRRYAGGSGQIHWFRVKPLFGESYKFPAQIVVNGEIVLDRSTAIERIKEARVIYQFMLAPLTFLAFLAGVFVMVVPRGIVSDRAPIDAQ